MHFRELLGVFWEGILRFSGCILGVLWQDAVLFSLCKLKDNCWRIRGHSAQGSLKVHMDSVETGMQMLIILGHSAQGSLKLHMDSIVWCSILE